MHAANNLDAWTIKFQSAPAITGGRCVAALLACRCVNGFNPRPPLLAGDAFQVGHGLGCQIVSIRARHYWRAMPGSQKGARGVHLFQSAPAITGGRCVSDCLPNHRCNGFNPRPPLLAGDATPLAV